jgi:hypothetical protein
LDTLRLKENKNMVSIRELDSDGSPATTDDLQKEVDRLRLEVELAQRGVQITEEGEKYESRPPM